MSLEEKMICLRKEKGLSQLEVAEALNVSRQAVSRWERGSALPAAENLRRLSQLYEVSVDVLLKEMEEVSPTKAEEGAAEETLGKNRGWTRRWLALAAAVILLLGIVLAIWIHKKDQDVIDLTGLPGEEVDGVPRTKFTLEW